jgi:demethylmenaquinone methyltransferase/2-methoxy-6-polyprenyl-1,4-benzoquinol methylase
LNKGLQKIYAEIPGTYEFLNHLMTLGTDIVCRNRAARLGAEGGGRRWLDVCTGTGELAQKLYDIKQNGTEIYGADFSLPMVQRARRKPDGGKIKFVISDAKALPFDDGFFDLVTISFAVRNINSTGGGLAVHFAEFCRVLRPGGRFICLETSQPKNKIFRKLMHLYVGLTVAPLGGLVSGSKGGYKYLATSIPRFFDADRVADILHEAGFSEVSYTQPFFGITAIHKAVK